MIDSSEIIAEISIEKIRVKFLNAIRRTFIHKYFLFFSLLAGALSGGSYAYFKTINYTATTTFIVEEKSISGGSIASLAGQFGLDIGGLSGSSGLFSVENILLMFNSVNMQKQVLLSKFDDSTSVTIADRYAEVYELKNKWARSSKVGVWIDFSKKDHHELTRIHDSLLYVIIEKINDHEQFVCTRPDKKTNFIQVNTTFREEKLARLFSERIVASSIDRFLFLKTQRQLLNINKLQRRADSLLVLLNAKSYVSAGQNEALLDLNPALKSKTVKSEIVSRDKMVLTTLFSEVTKNLEVAKLILSQETPTIQIIDPVRTPTENDKIKVEIGFLIGGLILFLFSFFAFFVFYFLKSPSIEHDKFA